MIVIQTEDSFQASAELFCWAGAENQKPSGEINFPSRGSGIGAFYDEEMRRHLDFSVARDLILRQIVIASPVCDPRLRA
jgi:hypothetical protein